MRSLASIKQVNWKGKGERERERKRETEKEERDEAGLGDDSWNGTWDIGDGGSGGNCGMKSRGIIEVQ